MKGKPNEASGSSRCGLAIVGIGEFTETQLIPAIEKSRFCRLVSIVTDTREKVKQYADKYKLDEGNCYTYETFDQCAENAAIDYVYIALPNGLHESWTRRAAAAGKHVLCEKPMATSAAACNRMIDACREAGVLLSIGYRLHFEPFNREIMRLATHEVFGPVQHIIARRGIIAREPGWRNDRALSGGGALMDLGIYCLQAAIYVMGKNPTAVSAREGEKRSPSAFDSVEESLFFQLEFPGGVLADCSCSYAEEMDELRVFTSRGEMGLSPAFSYEGFAGYSPEGPLREKAVDPLVEQLDDFAIAIHQNKSSLVSGEMGKRDLLLIDAIYRAMYTGEKIMLDVGSIPPPEQINWAGSYSWLEQSHLRF